MDVVAFRPPTPSSRTPISDRTKEIGAIVYDSQGYIVEKHCPAMADSEAGILGDPTGP